MNRHHRIVSAAAFVAIAAASVAGIASASTPDSSADASGSAAAGTETTVPAHDMSDMSETTAHEMVPGTLAADGSDEPTSPEAQAFCESELATEAAFNSEDEAMIGTAVEALTAAAEPVGMSETVGSILAAEPGSPGFDEPYASMIEYMKANCGFAQVDAVASEYTFEGVPAEIPAGPTIFGLENAGEQVHELAVMRINDDVDLSVDELLALAEEESETMVTPIAFAFAFPGTVSHATADLAPGRYFALCFLPEGATPEVLAQLEELGVDGPEDTIPADSGLELGPPHFTKGMVAEFTVT